VCVAGVEQLMKCHSCYLLCFNLDGMGLMRSIPQKRLGYFKPIALKVGSNALIISS
jgi:hypothetical protein